MNIEEIKELSKNSRESLTYELFENLETFIKKYQSSIGLDMNYIYIILIPSLIGMMTVKLFGHLSDNDREGFIEDIAMASKAYIEIYLNKEK